MTPTTNEHYVERDDHRNAVRTPGAHAFFWTVLTCAAAVSIAGNAAHAVLHSTTLPILAASVAVIPPIALLAAVHGAAILLRTQVRSGITHVVATIMTIVIATAAFWLSFTALRSLAGVAGIGSDAAWLLPVIIEGSMVQSTVAILAFARETTSRWNPTITDIPTAPPVPPVPRNDQRFPLLISPPCRAPPRRTLGPQTMETRMPPGNSSPSSRDCCAHAITPDGETPTW